MVTWVGCWINAEPMNHIEQLPCFPTEEDGAPRRRRRQSVNPCRRWESFWLEPQTLCDLPVLTRCAKNRHVCLPARLPGGCRARIKNNRLLALQTQNKHQMVILCNCDLFWLLVMFVVSQTSDGQLLHGVSNIYCRDSCNIEHIVWVGFICSSYGLWIMCRNTLKRVQSSAETNRPPSFYLQLHNLNHHTFMNIGSMSI